MYWSLTSSARCLYKEKKYFLLLFNWVWLKLLPLFRSKRGLEIYSGSRNTLFLHLTNYGLDSEGGCRWRQMCWSLAAPAIGSVVKRGRNQLKDHSHGLRIVTGRSLGLVAAFIQKVEQISCGQGGTQGMENTCHFAVLGVREPEKLYFAVQSSA